MRKHFAVVDIQDAAARWAARMDRGALSGPEAHQLETWLAADRRHLGAYARAQATLRRFDKAPALGSGFDPAAFPVRPRARPDLERRRVLWMGAVGAAAAGGLFAVTAGWPGESYATQRGEMRRVPLKDGSVITLNTATHVHVRFTGRERLVRLGSGEALFDVADERRPFVVEAGGVHVSALKASFSVRRIQDRPVSLMVRLGEIKVRDPVVEGDRTLDLSTNTAAELTPSLQVRLVSLSSTEVSHRLAWEDGYLSLNDETLAEAALEFSRYSDIQIVIDDPALAQERVVGLFSVNNPVAFSKAVATSLGLSVQVEPGIVRLQRPS